jgi:hypothetical protein
MCAENAMPWHKTDDRFPEHPKVIGLSLEAKGVWLELGCHAAKYLTDGIIPRQVAHRYPKPRLRELLHVHLLEPFGRDYRLHDYLDYNPSRDQWVAQQQRKVAAGRQGAAAKWAIARRLPLPFAGDRGTVPADRQENPGTVPADGPENRGTVPRDPPEKSGTVPAPVFPCTRLPENTEQNRTEIAASLARLRATLDAPPAPPPRHRRRR